MEKSNASHKYFIDRLTEAFEILGGKEWMTKRVTGQQESKDDETDEALISADTFSSLGINGDAKEKGAEEESAEEDHGEPNGTAGALLQKQKKTAAKGKKGKKGKQYKKPTAKQDEPTKQQHQVEVPLESYRIIQDEEGIITDYLMAVYSVFRRWGELRSFVQDLWTEVAYDGLNLATAGTLSVMAVAMIKRTEAAIFTDFPAGHDSYQTCMSTITRGDPEKAQSMFSVSLHAMQPGSNVVTPVQEKYIDVKEQFGIHAYHDLLDFIIDFQKNRTGNPTKRMQAQICEWDPNLDLQRISRDERIKWRRSFTINWLYDLVNVFSSILVQRNTLKGEHHKYEEQDWSVSGPWNRHRRLSGLNEFAGAVTTLAT